jgi:hypothetical protein
VVRRGSIVMLLGFASIASCTIYALSDDVQQEKCEFNPYEKTWFDDCITLNDPSDPDFDRCNNWRCGADHYCEIGPLDQDHDGFPPIACATAGQPGDCADRDPNSHPGAEEVCDGKDNDCDQSVDEGMLQVDERAAMVFDAGLRGLAFSRDDGATNDVAVVGVDAKDDAVSFGVIDRLRMASAQPLWLSDADDVFHAVEVNLSTRSGSFVLSVVEAAPTHRAYVGDVTSTAEHATLSLGDANLRQTGLRCASDEPCAAMQGPRTEVSPEHPEAQPSAGPAPIIPLPTRPELATLEGQVLVGYARALEPAADGCAVTSPAAPLLLNLLDLRTAGYSELTENAIRLDVSSELRSPLVVPIENVRVTALRGAFGWLVGYLDTSGGLVVRRVRPQTVDPLADLQLRLAGDPDPYLEARMVSGSVEGDRILIGITARAGCGDRARVVFGLLQLTWDSEGQNELRVYRELHEIGDPGQQASRPMLAYNRTQSLWAVAYATPDGLFVRVLDRNGVPTGGSAYRLTDTLPSVPDVTVVSGAPDEPGLFSVYSYEEHTDQSPTHVLVERELRTCSVSTTSSGGR